MTLVSRRCRTVSRERPGARAWVCAAILLGGGACGPARPPPPSSDAAAPGDAAAGPEPWTAGICDGRAAPGAWCWAYPRPAGARLNRLWGTGPRDVWAVGELGTIVHFDGVRWTRAPSGTRDSLVAIAGVGPGDAWAIGTNRTLLRLSGGVWRAVQLPSLDEDEALADLHVLPNGEAWIVGGMSKKAPASGETIVSRCLIGHLDAGAGAAWRFDEENDCGPLGRVWGTSPSDVWADGGDVVHWNGRYLTRNPKQKRAAIVGRHGHGSGWKLDLSWAGGGSGPLVDARRPNARLPNATDFWAWGPDEVWALTVGSGLAHFDGRRWSRGDDPVTLVAVAARAADDVWAVGLKSTLLHFDGRTWRSSRLPGSGRHSPLAMAVSGTDDVWVLTGGELMRFDGQRWATVLSSPPGSALSSLFVPGPSDAWVTAGSKVLHWNGRVVETIDANFNASRVFGDAHQVWVGWPLHRLEGGKLVTPSETVGPDGKSLNVFVAGASDGQALWLARYEGMSRLESGRLEIATGFPRGQLRAIWSGPAGEVWAVGSHVVHGGAASWTVEELPVDAAAIGGAQGLVWVLGPQGLLFRR